MKIYLLLIIICITLIHCTMPWRHALSGTSHEKKMNFDYVEFNQRYQLALSLSEDDKAAWWTSDTILSHPPVTLEKKDTTWFVCLSGKERLIYYGRYNPITSKYQAKYAFKMTGNHSIHPIDTAINDSISLYAKAVYFGCNRFSEILDSLAVDFKFNHYIRRNSDRSFSLWFFPAGSGSYCTVGSEFYFILPPTADTVVATSIINDEFKYCKIPAKTSLFSINNASDLVPSIGKIFFTIIYSRYVSKITIINSNTISTAFISSENTDTLFWKHTTKK